ncbi:RDD family protein [soil metagenome]
MVDVTRPRGIVTPEAVVLEFETAGVGSRVLAIFIDLIVQYSAIFAGLLAATAVGQVSNSLAIIVAVLVVFLGLFGYPIGMETFCNGRTLGHAAMGLRVVTIEGAPIRFRHAAIRGFLSLFDFYLPVPGGLVAVISVLASPRNQRLGDLAAGTIVLRERSATSASHAVTFPAPYGYESYVASLDTSAVTGGQYSLIRSFLLRVLQLAPAARYRLALTLANPVTERMGHTPPPGVGPELFRACVASAYQRRHGGGVPVTPAPWAGPAPPPNTAPPPPPPPPTAFPARPEDRPAPAPAEPRLTPPQ